MQNIYVYDPYGKVGKLIWYRGRAFYSYVVTYNHHSYYYKENISLHNGNGGSDYHYWWSYAEDLKLISSVRTLIERRQHG